MKLLMHVCCGPCVSAIAESLLPEAGMQLTGCWYNPNIHPDIEHDLRAASAMQAADQLGFRLVDAADFMDPAVSGVLVPGAGMSIWNERFSEGAAGRCSFCYSSRLDVVAETAARNGFDAFSTSLMISPYQSREAMLEAGVAAQNRFGVRFLDTDFRPLYRRSRELTRANGWYSQKYCGCLFSWSESDHPKKPAYEWPFSKTVDTGGVQMGKG